MYNWKTVKLGDIGEIIGGATPSTKKSEYYNGNIAWITPKDMSLLQGRYISHGERNISKVGFENSSTKMLPKNSVVFTSRAPIGYVGINNVELCTNQGFKSIIPNEQVNYMFLYYLLVYNKDKIEAQGSGTTFKEVSGSVMKNIEVSIPPLEEQRKIASILSALDDKIELNQKINRNLELQAQAIFEDGLNRAEDYISLGAFCNFIKGKKPKNIKSIQLQGYQPYLTIDTLRGNNTTYADTTSMVLVNEMDILMVMDGASSGIVYFGKEGVVASTLAKIEVNPRYMLFLEMIYQTLKFNEKDINSHTTGSAIPHTDKNYTLSLKIPLFKGIDKVTKTLYFIRKQIVCNNKEIETLKSIRDTLLPKLMNGEIDVGKIANESVD